MEWTLSAEDTQAQFQGMNFDTYAMDGDSQTGDATAQAVAIKPERITKEAFFVAFKAMFGLSGSLLALQSLPISESEEMAAREASDALYETALVVPFLSFLITPANEWAGRIAAIGLFTWGKYHVVRAELDARKPKKPKQGETAKDITPNPVAADMGEGDDLAMAEGDPFAHVPVGEG